jgi:hypothetical protein
VQVLKQVVKLLGLIKYADCENVDDLRIAVIKSLQPGNNVVILQLLQDELPEIRSKAAKLVSKYSSEYLLHNYFSNLTTHHLIRLSLESTYLDVKRKNHTERKIFAFDKGNKFHCDLKVQFLALQELRNRKIDSNNQDL